MGGDGAGKKVTDKSRAERGRNLQPQVKSKRRGGNPGDTQTEARERTARAGISRGKSSHVQGEEQSGHQATWALAGGKTESGKEAEAILQHSVQQVLLPLGLQTKECRELPGTWHTEEEEGQGSGQVAGLDMWDTSGC